ncbi:MAG: ComF family protein [Rhizobiaceae bacterium]|nr:ComF family protein [Rhizobiaceae bacterium]
MVNLAPHPVGGYALGTRVERLARAMINMIVPPTCLGCDLAVGQVGALCGSCWSSLRFIEHPYCAVLGTPFAYDPGFGSVSLRAIAEPPDFDRSRSVVLYDEVARKIIRSLKFGDRPELAPWMARWMLRAGGDVLHPGALIVPVPLHRNRLLQRRYNQSAELARNLARITQQAFRPDLLQRIRPTRQQVGLGANQRARNVRGAFRVPTSVQIHVKSSHIVLIDDVYTTGATLQACARALRRKGAAKIDCLTFARVANGVAITDL